MIELLTTIIQTPYTSEVLYKFLTGIATGIVLGFETDSSVFLHSKYLFRTKYD